MTDTAPAPQAPRSRHREWFQMKASADTAEVYLYDAIDPWWGVTANDFVKAFAGLDVDRIDLYINSPGGDVFDAIAILNAIRRHPAQVTAHVDGIAASAASFIAMGADEVVMGRNASLMIHDAAGLCWGQAADMEDTARRLDEVSDNIARIYADRAGGTLEQWRQAMRDTTWYDDHGAVEAGLADRVDEDRDKSELVNSIDLSYITNTREHRSPMTARAGTWRPAATASGTKPPAEPETQKERPQQEEGDTMSSSIKEGLIERLGLTADAAEEAIFAALDDALTTPATDEKTPFKAPEGTELVDSATLADLREQAAAGVEARNQQIAEHRAQIVDTAVAEGRIPPARREHWIAQLNADEEGTLEVLSNLAEGTIPLKATGYTGGVNESADEDTTQALYSRAWGDTTTTKEA